MDPVDQAQDLEERMRESGIAAARSTSQKRYTNTHCRECGETIPGPRVGISPWCVDCARDQERWERTVGIGK